VVGELGLDQDPADVEDQLAEHGGEVEAGVAERVQGLMHISP
jgi:hypothetical protein